jgi:AAA domain
VWTAVGIGGGLTFNLWRPVIVYPVLAAWNTVLYFLDQRRPFAATPLLRYHSAFWDEHQRLPLYGLDDHLVLTHQRRPAEAEAALAYLSTSPNSHQRWAVRAVQIELDLLRLEACKSPEDIAAAAARATTRPDKPGDFQRAFERVAEDTGAALAQDSNLTRRLGLQAARDRLDALIRDLRLSNDRSAPRLERIVAAWSKILDARIEALATETELAQEIDNPYVTGVALDESAAVCAPRIEIGDEIERLILDQRKPPLLLYGQRRMGKTSLLKVLGKRLRSDLVPLLVDLQGPAGQAANHAGFLFNLARSAVASALRFRNLTLPPLTEESLAADPFTRFDVWLDEVEAALGERSALLLMDEMEALDDAFEEGRFKEAQVLGMLRNLIQHRPKLKILLAGSHDFEELVRWSSYLINVRTVRLGYLTEKEATRLVEAPIPGFPLRYEPEALARVLSVTRGHPFLVQLLCGEIVTHMNGKPPGERRLARAADVEASVARALDRGEMYFGEVETRQARADGAALLRRLAEKGEGAVLEEAVLVEGVEGAAEILRRLLRREIVEQEGTGYRFKVELIRRWFVSRRPVGALSPQTSPPRPPSP